MNYVCLRHYHKNVQSFKHPLLKGAEWTDSETLDEMARDVLSGQSPDELVLALRWYLSLLVGRFLANWPETFEYLEDMVSEGMSEIVRLCNNIPLDTLAKRGILVIATSRAQAGIENMLNKLRSLSAPSHSTQMRRIAIGQSPIYRLATYRLDTEDGGQDGAECRPASPSDEDLRDVLEAFAKLQPEDEIDMAILAHNNWGSSNMSLANKVGASVTTIMRRRRRLYRQYLKLTE